jgi:hypothetical protein
MPDSYRVGRGAPRLLAYSLFASLLLHGLLLWRIDIGVAVAPETLAPLRATYRRGQAAAANSAVVAPTAPLPAQDAPGAVIESQPRGPATPANPAADESAMTRSLDLTLPPLPSDAVVPGITSGTVFDPGLRRRIAAQRSARAASRDAPAGYAGQESFEGGRWRQFLRLGDSCFQVVGADPLDSLGSEQWYRVRCP